MDDIDMTKLPNPASPEIQEHVIGNAARVAVAVNWALIEHLLESDLPVAAIYRRLRKAGRVKVTRQAFTRQVKARREGARGPKAAAKPSAEPGLEPGPVGAAPAKTEAPRRETPTPSGKDGGEAPEKRGGNPHRPWRTGPREAPDPTKLFKPRDPLADDDET